MNKFDVVIKLLSLGAIKATNTCMKGCQTHSMFAIMGENKKNNSVTKEQLTNLRGKNKDLLKTIEDNIVSGKRVLVKKHWSFSVLFTRK